MTLPTIVVAARDRHSAGFPVVPDLDAAIRTYEEVYGIGPWDVFEVGPEMIEGEVLVYGSPPTLRWRSGLAGARHVSSDRQ
jgi:hypothetical protein